MVVGTTLLFKPCRDAPLRHESDADRYPDDKFSFQLLSFPLANVTSTNATQTTLSCDSNEQKQRSPR